MSYLLNIHKCMFQVINELNKSRKWAQLHIADSSCFHYRQVSLSTHLMKLMQLAWARLDLYIRLSNWIKNGQLILWFCTKYRQIGCVKACNSLDLSQGHLTSYGFFYLFSFSFFLENPAVHHILLEYVSDPNMDSKKVIYFSSEHSILSQV